MIYFVLKLSNSSLINIYLFGLVTVEMRVTLHQALRAQSAAGFVNYVPLLVMLDKHSLQQQYHPHHHQQQKLRQLIVNELIGVILYIIVKVKGYGNGRIVIADGILLMNNRAINKLLGKPPGRIIYGTITLLLIVRVFLFNFIFILFFLLLPFEILINVGLMVKIGQRNKTTIIILLFIHGDLCWINYLINHSPIILFFIYFYMEILHCFQKYEFVFSLELGFETYKDIE